MKKMVMCWLWFFVGMTFMGCSAGTMRAANPTPDNLVAPGPVILESEQANTNRVVTFTVTGKGLEPETALTKGQAVLMAERAAVTDGYRQFVEKLRGVYVDALSQVGYGMVDQDYVNTCTRAMLRGVEVKEIIHGRYGITSAVMTLRIKFTQKGMIWWPEGLGQDVQFVERLSMDDHRRSQSSIPKS